MSCKACLRPRYWPVGSQRAFHPEGELAVARAARSKKHLQCLSTVASTSVEDVTDARGAPIWYQLYPTDHWPITQALVRRAEAAGCPVLALTVDLTPISMSWDYIQRLRDIWPRKLIIKGIVTREDAELAVQHGLDGVLVSNHGGRAEDSGRASIDSLVEVVAGDGRRDRTALYLGTGVVRTGTRREGARDTAGRVVDRDAAGGDAQHRRDQPSVHRR